MGIELPVVQPKGRGAGVPPIFQKVGIAGLGLIGGSIALAVRELWPESLVIAVDNQGVLETAMRMHAVDVGGDDLGMLAEADLVILAAPVRQNLALLDQLPNVLHARAVVTDTGSTKREIVAAARQLPEHLTFVAGHPLSGAAAGGIEHARPDLFKGRPWLFAPPEAAAGGDALEKLWAFAGALGSFPQVVEADVHDRWLAYISHLPQLMASALMNVVGEAVGEDGLALAGRGLIDTTRLASSPPAIWRDIAVSNADQLGPALDEIIEMLQSLRRGLGEGAHLNEVFEGAVRWRARLLKP